MASDGAREQFARPGVGPITEGGPMADPFPSLHFPEIHSNGPTRTRGSNPRPSARPDMESQDAFPSLGAGASAKPPAWVSHVPVIQRVMHQTSLQLRLEEDQLAKLSQLLQRVQANYPHVKIEASTTRKTNVTTFILRGTNEESVQAAKKELTALFARRVTLSVWIPASLRAYVIGAGGKNIKAITEETGVRIQIPPRTSSEPMYEAQDPLLDQQVEVVIDGDEVNALQAQARIEALVAERTSKLTQRITDIDPTYYPFIAGARNAHALRLAETLGNGEANVHVPPRSALLAREGAARDRDLAIVVNGDREAVQSIVSTIHQDVARWKSQFRTLSMNIPKRQHSLLVGDNAADILEATGCVIELPSVQDPSDSVLIRGPQQQLPHALTAALDKASAVSIQNLALDSLHPDADPRHAKHLAHWLAMRAPTRMARAQGVQVYYPRANTGSHLVEVVGPDAQHVAHVASELEQLARAIEPSLIRTVDLDPLAHGMVIGKKGQNLKSYEARGVDVLIPPENSGQSEIVLVLGRPESLQNLPVSRPEREQGAEAVLDSVASDLRQIATTAADMRTEQLEIPAQFHKAIVGPDGTVLNAIIGDDPLMINVGAARDARAKNYALRPLTDDSILVRGTQDAVQRALAQLQQIAHDAEQDQIVHSHVEELPVPSQFVPHLIGRGGSGIAKLREELGVKIDVPEADERRSGPATIRITGRKECAEEARTRLATQAKRLADEQTVMMAVPASMYGAVIGPGGKYVTRLQDKYDVRIHFPPERQASEDGQVSLRGSKKGVAEAKAEIAELIEYERQNSYTETIRVSRKAVPKLLGRNGATINQLRLDTGAQIDLERKEAGASLRLRGTRAAVEAARERIEEIVAQADSEAVYTLQIPSRFHGNLIGSGGQHLKQLILRAGGPDDPKAHAQYVRFPRGNEPSDSVTIRAPKEIADNIAQELEAETKKLADRVVYGVAVPPSLHRQLIAKGGTRQSDWQTQQNVSLVLPNWREYKELGEPVNAEALQDTDTKSSIVKVTGPVENVPKVMEDIAKLLAQDQARKQRSNTARIDQDA
ncbi:hypothetical protein MYAM1_003655 [Malassezia yamatoensis]|uniref:K Homology domain-containing protein n=1 Tax=Malassezia yamatoensis TaxID=253288 RepID=A0AAJ5YX60_9BASI|nr:hypothetical protein MYAM1_003655 [Malassezia yamatoensis]